MLLKLFIKHLLLITLQELKEEMEWWSGGVMEGWSKG